MPDFVVAGLRAWRQKAIRFRPFAHTCLRHTNQDDLELPRRVGLAAGSGRGAKFGGDAASAVFVMGEPGTGRFLRQTLFSRGMSHRSIL